MNHEKLISELNRMLEHNRRQLKECVSELNKIGDSEIVRTALGHYRTLLEENIERYERDLKIALHKRKDVS